MSKQKNKASIVWNGQGTNFQGHLGSGYHFELGSGSEAVGGSPMEFLLAGVAGCTAVDVVLILQKQRQEIHGLEVQISGIRAEEHPKVYTEVDLHYIIQGKDINTTAVEKAISLSKEKYCSASAIFKQAGVKISSSYQIEEKNKPRT